MANPVETVDLTKDIASAELSIDAYDGDSGTSVRPDPNPAPAPRNCEPDDRQSLIASRKPVPASAGQENQLAAGKPTERRSIRAADYKKLEIPEGRSICYCCGGKGAWYVEKLTAERKARPKDQQYARRICKVCYLEAARKVRAGTPPLPGIISLVSMERISSSVGRCSVCDLAPAVYLDRGTGVRLCEACYSREAMHQTMKRRVGGNP